jgi:hypothetical protein
MSKQKRNSFRPELTQLESREVPAVSSIGLNANVLVVRCNNAPTNVLVNQTAATVLVRDVTNNRSWSFSASQVNRVDVFGGGGADGLISRGPATAKLVRLLGQGGNDTILGGNGREVADGGAGSDLVRGGGSNDVLRGGDGNDTVFGDGGNDFLDGGNGNDNLNGGVGGDIVSGGGGSDTIVTIDGATTDTADPGLGTDFIWVDKNGSLTDAVIGGPSAEFVNEVTGFENAGADRTLNGDRITDPTPLAGDQLETFVGRPLFGPAGPTVNDINQGALGDCWILAGLGAIANENPNIIRANVVDFGDGTYGVRLRNSFYRVDNDLPVADFGESFLNYTALGQGGSLWVSIIEKAYTHYRVPGANSYFSIEGGFTFDLYEAFRLDAGFLVFGQFGNAASLGAAIKLAVDNGQAPTIGIDNPSTPMLLADHQYIVLGYNVNGSGQLTDVIMRNPWAIDGGTIASGDPNDGIITITIAQLFACTGFTTLDFADVP